MKRLTVALVGAVLLGGGLAAAEEHEMHLSKVAITPQWESIKSLVGEWDGYTMEGGKKLPTHVSVRMTGDGSAAMHVIDAGTPHEMVTMFHMDRESLMATHYCSAHNQPRFVAAPSTDAKNVVFEFKDGTNIRPGDGHMGRLAITFVDADHHNEDWGYDLAGKLSNRTFYMARVKATAQH
jgi:YD repeat-containing protein